MKKLMILLCSFAAGVAMADEYGDLLPEAARDWPRQFLESQNRPSALADHNVYIVTNDVVFTGEAGESSLRVAENASVCILICEGASLTCHGGDGLPASSGGDGVVPAFSNETVQVSEAGSWDFTYEMPRFALAAAGEGGAGGQGGGAGIEVSSDSTLEICGSGCLEAIGGAGGAGGDSGSVSGDNHASEMPVSLCGTNGLDVVTEENGPDKDVFLSLDGIDGESKDSRHDLWIDLLSFSHSAALLEGTDIPDDFGRGVTEPVVIKHLFDKATPKIQELCTGGGFIDWGCVEITRTVAGWQELAYRVEFEGIQVVSAVIDSEELPDGNFRIVETVKLLVNKLTSYGNSCQWPIACDFAIRHPRGFSSSLPSYHCRSV